MRSTDYDIRMYPAIEWICPYCGKVNVNLMLDVEDYLEDCGSDICEECHKDVKLNKGFNECRFLKHYWRSSVSPSSKTQPICTGFMLT